MCQFGQGWREWCAPIPALRSSDERNRRRYVLERHLRGPARGRLAAEAGLADRLTAHHHDLRTSFPAGAFDLVCAHYLHTPLDLDRTAVLRTAAHALRPGGRLLVVDHGSTAPWSWTQDPHLRYPTPQEVAADLALSPGAWTVERADAQVREATGPDGRTAEVTDHILIIRRTA